MSEGAPSTIGGRFRVVREIGRGGMGVVYEVLGETGARYAVKTMAWGHDRPDLVERFRREARASELIACENVVNVFEMGAAPELGGAPFLVMELLEGETVTSAIATHGRFAPAFAVDVFTQAARALDRAHAAGYVHRDLKPDNLFLHRGGLDGRRTVVKVLDFGVARLMDDDATAITATGATVGSVHYMSPEQMRSDKKSIGPRADVWAMGMLAIDLFTGEKYWGSMKPSRILQKLPSGPPAPPTQRFPWLGAAFDAWFLRACAVDPAARFASAGEQAAALAHAARGISTPAASP